MVAFLQLPCGTCAAQHARLLLLALLFAGLSLEGIKVLKLHLFG